MIRLLKSIAAPAFGTLLLALATGCASTMMVKSYPEGANVYSRDVVSQEKKLLGKTPLNLKKEKDSSEVFFLILEKENFYPKQVLMTPRDGESISVAVTLDPLQDASKVAKNEGEDGKEQGQGNGDGKKKEDEMKDLNLRIALLENTISMYKDALFSNRFSAGMAPFDRDRTDNVVDHLFKAQQLVMSKKFTDAQEELDKALLINEYLPQAYLLRGTIFYVNKDYEQAKIAWERSIKIDPHNPQAYEYLRLVSKKLGQTPPPERPSQLRAPASDPLSRSLRR